MKPGFLTYFTDLCTEGRDCMDDLMNDMLLLDDDEEDEPTPGKKSGCGCLPMMLLGVLIVIFLAVLGNG